MEDWSNITYEDVKTEYSPVSSITFYDLSHEEKVIYGMLRFREEQTHRKLFLTDIIHKPNSNDKS